ncbi:MAG TPA: tRNA (adenosine(37)-N6)-threonylcarbamoyltransferase complex dimerization subunit type 1 TsaB [Cyclobacteriaceae bacterium]|nr:tRNA (adenosine(37)-N6)-threonylcarbamoyltransferase complex dimerization subunit type 1 TsaB [Cyclobacteriaceae bacterium]
MILSIETSTTVCSAALHDEGRLIASEIIHTPNSAASQLAVMIDKILGSGNIDAVAVSAGPGSYTGLRIGVATAKGICYGLDVPLIAVSSLELMALQVRESSSGKPLFCPMIDARRMEVYTALFDTSLDLIEPIQARIIDSASYADVLERSQVFFFGNGADKCRGVIDHPHAQFIPGIFPSAEWLGRLAWPRFRDKKFEDVAEFEPFYLKDFIAKKPKSLV